MCIKHVYVRTVMVIDKHSITSSTEHVRKCDVVSCFQLMDSMDYNLIKTISLAWEYCSSEKPGVKLISVEITCY